MAWPQAQALEIVRALKGSTTVVLGGDLYQNKGDRVVPTYLNWHCERRRAEPLESYARRSRQEASDFIASQSVDFLFALVLSCEPTAGM